MVAKALAPALSKQSYLTGESFSVANILAGHTLLWAKSTRVELKSQPLDAYLQRLQAREAMQRALAKSTTAGPAQKQ